jgi:parallel beta-helix repeat protein
MPFGINANIETLVKEGKVETASKPIPQKSDSDIISGATSGQSSLGPNVYNPDTGKIVPSPEALEVVKNDPKTLVKSGYEILGIKDPSLITDIDTASALTITTFDYTSRSGEVNILLTNSTGGDVKIRNASIRGKIVISKSGAEGFIHDSFVDHDSIYREGMKTYEFGNDFVVTKTQLEQLADFYWKEYRTKKHMYRVTLPGVCHWIEIGDWWTLDVGSTLGIEDINSVVQVYDVQVEKTIGGIGSTQVTFREVQESWTKTSSATARFLASGNARRLMSRSNIVTVGASTWTGTADYLCDGTDDHVEIQAAIDLVKARGGVVQLTEGTFNITAGISLYSNVSLSGQGAKTIISKNCNDHGIKAIGLNLARLSDITVNGLAITKVPADTNTKDLIHMEYVNTLTIDRNTVYGSQQYGIYMTHCQGILVEGNTATANNTNIISLIGSGKIVSNECTSATQYGIVAQCGMVISNNICSSNGSHGILLLETAGATVTGNQCYSNTGTGILGYYFTDGTLSGNACSANWGYGIILDYSSRCSVASNNLYGNAGGIALQNDCDNNTLSGNSATSNTAYGIWIVQNTCNTNVVTGNRSTGNGTSNYTDSGTGTTQSGNNFT